MQKQGLLTFEVCMYQSFLYLTFMCQIVHFQNFLEGQLINKNRLLAPLFILLEQINFLLLLIMWPFLTYLVRRIGTSLKNSTYKVNASYHWRLQPRISKTNNVRRFNDIDRQTIKLHQTMKWRLNKIILSSDHKSIFVVEGGIIDLD